MSDRHQGSNLSRDARDVTPVAKKEEGVMVAKVRPPDFETDQEWHGFQLSVKRAYDAGQLPECHKTFTDALLVACRGREMGLPPLYSLTKFFSIGKKVGMESEAMRALVYRKYPDARLEYVTPTEKRHEEATFVACRPGANAKEQRFTFTIEDACTGGMVQKAGNGYKATSGKPTWDKSRQSMLIARATALAVRTVFPECVMGCGYTPDELEDTPAQAVRVAADLDSKFSSEMPSSEALPPAAGGFVTVPSAPAADAFETVQQGLDAAEQPFPGADGEKVMENVPRGTPQAAEGGAFAGITTPGEFVPSFGRFMGKRLDSVPLADLKEYLTKQLKPQAEKGDYPKVKELIEVIESFIEHGI